MKWFQTHKKALVIAIAFMLISQAVPTATAYVPVRISIKFILDAGGNRPATGNLNTDAEINAEVDWANTILADNMSELRMELLELVDITGVSQYYGSDADETNRDNLRSDAMSDPTTYSWRNNAINIYINGGTGSAISAFPPYNDIILLNQWCGNTPSCVLHELGHSLDLLHTHDQDHCADTIQDEWCDNFNVSGDCIDPHTRDEISMDNFGQVYNDLTPAQQDQVDMVFNNVMSYHTGEPQLRLSYCQMDRKSSTADSDRGWLLARTPVYVDSTYTGSESGRFPTPYITLQSAINAGLSGKVVVLQQGSHTAPTSVMNVSSYMVTRFGTSTVGQGCLLYSLPTDLENSKTPEVRNAIKAVQADDNAARKVMREAKAAVKTVVIEEVDPNKADPEPEQDDRSPILENAEAARKVYEGNAIAHLLKAETFATGKEKVAILLELAQRYKYSGNCAEAIVYFMLVADNTTQPYLRERALFEANHCQEMLEKSWGSLVSEEQNDNALN